MSNPAQGFKKLHVEVFRRSAAHAEMVSPQWRVTLATTSEKPVGAPNPPLTLLGALAACTLSSIRRGAQANGVQIDDAKVVVDATRAPTPEPHFQDIKVHLTIFSPEPEERLMPVLEAVKSNGTVTNTLKKATDLTLTYEIVNRRNSLTAQAGQAPNT